MKKNLLTLATLLTVSALFAQNQTFTNANITVTNPASYPYGINIDNNFTGGWAREFSFSSNGSGKLFVFGAYGSDNTLNYGYIGGNTTSTTAHATPWMAFRPNGYVGIGTTFPSSKLHVQASTGSIELARFFNSDYATGVGSGLMLRTGSATGDTYVNLQAYTAGATNTGNLVLNPNGGNVGIGTTTPSALLHVAGTYNLNGTNISAILGSEYNHWTYFGGVTGGRIRGCNTGFLVVESNPNGTSDKNLYLNFESPGNIIIAKGGGNVGIGTTAPVSKLHVQASSGSTSLARFFNNDYSTGVGSGLSITTGSPTGNTYSRMQAFTSGATSPGNLMLNPDGGYIGIGTITPTSKLQVVSTNYNDIFTIKRVDGIQGNTFDFRITANPDGTSTYLNPRSLTIMPTEYDADFAIKTTVAVSSPQFVVKSTGNVGIGTTTPIRKLHIEGTADGDDRVFVYLKNNSTSASSSVGINLIAGSSGKLGAIGFTSDTYSYSKYSQSLLIQSTGSNGIQLQSLSGNIIFSTGLDATSHYNERMVITPTGNVLIGQTTQTNTTYKLDVAGKIRANEIVVNTTGADFVFEENYNLRSLSEVEQFVKENKHLPEIAPAAEMQASGVSVSELQTQLLQKVEELTLYIIEQNKRIAELEQAVNKSKKE
jgi:hypothetical protein